MAAITASATGNWNATTTWAGGVIPISGDSVTIPNGITVTIPGGYVAICGTSPVSAGAACLVTTGTGKLVINGTFRYRGRMSFEQGEGVLSGGAGGVLEHDSSVAAAPVTTNYAIQLGTISLTRTSAQFFGTGRGANRFTLRNFTGSGNSGGFTNGGNDSCGLVQGKWVTATNQGVSGSCVRRPALYQSGDACFFENSLLTSCGSILEYNCNNGCSFYLLNTTILTPRPRQRGDRTTRGTASPSTRRRAPAASRGATSMAW
jgi:hypothetical protein